jgi:hypothetical protein
VVGAIDPQTLRYPIRLSAPEVPSLAPSSTHAAMSLLAQAAVLAYPDGIKCLQDRLAISFASSPDAFAA